MDSHLKIESTSHTNLDRCLSSLKTLEDQQAQAPVLNAL